MIYYVIEDGDGIRTISSNEYDDKVKRNDFFNILGEYGYKLIDLYEEEIC